MITCAPDRNALSKAILDSQTRSRSRRRHQGSIEQVTTTGHHLAKLFLVPFFVVHYGIFCLVHGTFVFVLLGNQWPRAGGGPVTELGEMITNILSGGTLLAALALVGSHLFSFLYNFLFRGEYRTTNVMLLMAAPYGRIVVLHLAILFGAFAIQLLGQPVVLLILLIAGKTLIDWTLHLRSHDKLAKRAAEPPVIHASANDRVTEL